MDHITTENKSFRPLTDKCLTESDLEKAQKELNETPEKRSTALGMLRAMLADEKALNPRTEDSYLLKFLRARKFDCSRAFKLMKEYYKLRVKYPEVFRSPKEIEEVMKKGFAVTLDYRNSDGTTIYLFRPGRWNPEEVIWEDFVAASNLVSEYELDSPVTQIYGFTGIWDTAGFSRKQLLQVCRPWRISMLKACLQDCFPGRLKRICAINCEPNAVRFWNIIAPFLKQKLRSRMHVIGSDLSELHKLVNPDILPQEYGGKMPPFNYQKAAEQILCQDKFFKQDFKFGYQTISS